MKLTPSGHLREAIVLYERLRGMVETVSEEQQPRLARLALRAGKRMDRLGTIAFDWEERHHFAHTSYPNTTFQGRDRYLAILAQDRVPKRGLLGGWY